MTSNSRRSLGLLLFGVLASAWLYAGYRLWQTSVPDDLKTPSVDFGSLVAPNELERAQHFSFVVSLLGLVGLLLPLVVLAVYAKYGNRFLGESAAGPIGTGMLLAMIGLAIVWISMTVPGMVELWWYRKYDYTSMGYVEWLIVSWFSLAPEFEIICLTILIVVGFARLIGNYWWLAAAPVFVAVVALIVFIEPYQAEAILEPLRDNPELVQAEDRIAARMDMDKIPLRVEETGPETTQPNAYAFGLGPSRRVVFWSTILDGRFSEPELETVLAHELSHHKHNDIAKMIALFGLTILPIGLAIALITRRRGGMGVPTAVPLFLFLWIAGQTAFLPLNNAFTRRMEAEADWTALEATRNPGADEQLFKTFFETTTQDPDPPKWDQMIFGTHPTFEQRIEMARAWEARQAAEAGG